ncbi:hypothetical protein I0Q91_05665 [Halanaerobiaceae bacterium Z-7014]|uniref:Uncharacterized protein n=1 Tax=Halonatronomonas betaini TaxID=2778430 RepID=A0A931F655_9FIRM|nr:hypothetical protein [Halonatronomonas betaini]MBF8436555.1 hypothetical protein [Halonatronomonas betaini]
METNKKIIYNHKAIIEKDREVIPEIFDYLLNDPAKLELIKRKGSKNTAVYYYNHEGRGYFIKHFYFRKWTYALKEIIGSPIGLTSYRKSIKMLVNHIPVATPLAAIIYDGTRSKKDSVYISQELENSVLVNDLIKENKVRDIPKENMESLTLQMADIWAKMLNNNFIHKDPNSKNFMITDLNGEPEIYLIDIADIFALPYAPEFLKIHSMARFFGKFAKSFIQSEAEFDKKYFDIFEEEFSRNYNFKGSNEKFIAKVKKLTRKKYQWRLDRDRS